MSAVVSDTSPINYLIRIGEIDLLPKLFGEVLIPPAVLQELQHAGGLEDYQAHPEDGSPWETVKSRILGDR